MSDPHVRFHRDPRITANELARFMVSSDVARLTIIRNAREAKTPPMVRYKTAREAVTNFLTSPHRDIKIIHAAEGLLKQRIADPTTKAFQRQDAELSLEALAACAKMANLLAAIDFHPAPKGQTSLDIEGVQVSVNLNALVHAQTKKKELIGGALLRLTKADDNESEASTAKRQMAGGFAATLAYMHVLAHFNGQDGREASPAHCYSIDVQYRDVHAAAAQLARRVDNLKAACRIIKAMWGSA